MPLKNSFFANEKERSYTYYREITEQITEDFDKCDAQGPAK